MDLAEQFYQRACDALGFRHPYSKLSDAQRERVGEAAESFARVPPDGGNCSGRWALRDGRRRGRPERGLRLGGGDRAGGFHPWSMTLDRQGLVDSV